MDSSGYVGMLDGSAKYTGGHYYAAISNMRKGADLAHVFCPRDAAIANKAYSPDMIVHPLLDGPSRSPRCVSGCLAPRCSSSDRVWAANGTRWIQWRWRRQDRTRSRWYSTLLEQQSDMCGYHNAVLMSNAVEFDGLYNAVMQEELAVNHYVTLCCKLGTVAVAEKLHKDLLVCGDTALCCAEPGCARCCGGQGDLLAGALSTMLHWTRTTNKPLAFDARLTAAYGALLTQRASRLTSKQCVCNMLTSDMLDPPAHGFRAAARQGRLGTNPEIAGLKSETWWGSGD